MITALMDRSAVAHARMFEQASLTLKSQSVNKLAGIVPKMLRPEPFVSEQRGALLEIARMAKAGSAQLFTSRVGFDEAFRIARWPDAPSALDILAYLEVSLEWASLPFDFAKIPGVYGDDIEDTDRYKRALETIISPSWTEGLLNNPDAFRLTTQEVEHIRKIAPVLKLAGPKSDHLLDIFQLWTAEINRFTYFVTCDRKFIRFMTKTMKNPFAARPILPSDLCKKHEIAFSPLDPGNKEDFFLWGEVPLKRLIEAHDRGEQPRRSLMTRDEYT